MKNSQIPHNTTTNQNGINSLFGNTSFARRFSLNGKTSLNNILVSSTPGIESISTPQYTNQIPQALANTLTSIANLDTHTSNESLSDQ